MNQLTLYRCTYVCLSLSNKKFLSCALRNHICFILFSVSYVLRALSISPLLFNVAPRYSYHPLSLRLQVTRHTQQSERDNNTVVSPTASTT